MPRPARRSLLPGYPLHVLQRGHNRAACFLSDADRELYLGLLQQYGRRYACAVHAYVLMTNHVHLLVSPPDIPSISRLMRDVNHVFGQAFNRRHTRCGSVWQGRFKSCLVDSASYFLKCQRYIELNPVRAGMARSPRHYPWSSYKANAEGQASALVTAHARYLGLGTTPEGRRAAYGSLFATPLTEEEVSRIRAAIHRNQPLGDDDFLSRIEGQLQGSSAEPVPNLSQVPVPYLAPV